MWQRNGSKDLPVLANFKYTGQQCNFPTRYSRWAWLLSCSCKLSVALFALSFTPLYRCRCLAFSHLRPLSASFLNYSHFPWRRTCMKNLLLSSEQMTGTSVRNEEWPRGRCESLAYQLGGLTLFTVKRYWRWFPLWFPWRPTCSCLQHQYGHGFNLGTWQFNLITLIFFVISINSKLLVTTT